LEQGGRTLAATPLLSSAVMAAMALKLLGNEEQQKKYLPAIAAGELLAAIAIDEGPVHAPAAIACKATAVNEGIELNGSKTMVADGHIADIIIVVARSQASDDIALFIVKPDDPGVRIDRLHTVDHRNMARMRLEHTVIGKRRALGSLAGQEALEKILDAGRIAIAAESLGLMQEVFDRTIDYLKERKQFGVVIGSFQALKHRAAEMYAEIEICRSLLLDALQAWENDRDDLAFAASMVKAKCADTSKLVTNEGLQMHGGIGMTDELDIGLFMKRARVLAAWLGNASFHRDRIATMSGF
jgi:alkylation response protein AidB-like acyl-CoA dehydrogenase